MEVHAIMANMLKALRYAAPMMLISILLLLGCAILDEELLQNSKPSGDETGTIIIELTDAPLLFTDVEEFHVFIERIEYYSFLEDWQTLVEIGQDYDLLKLRNGKTASLTVQELEAGNYSALRMVLGKGNWLYVDDGVSLQRVNLKLARDESALVKLVDNFEIGSKQTSRLTVDFDAEKSLISYDGTDAVMDPSVKTTWNKTAGKTVLAEDFGVGMDQDDIPGWFEQEHHSLTGKCVVLDGSPLGGRFARMYGKDLSTLNHYFGKQVDLSGDYTMGTLSFYARGSDNWGYRDTAYLEFFYEGQWHTVYTFKDDDWVNLMLDNDDGDNKSVTRFLYFEFPITEEMMSVEFWFRFRNGMTWYNEFIDVDNVVLYLK
jgi:hypothetical protein